MRTTISGLALMRQGRLAEAEAALRHALALRPDFALPHSNILFCLNYRPDVSAEDIFAEYRRWDRQHALPLLPAQPGFDLDRSPERRLRIGYVSPDFRQHAVALFAEPLLAAHDRSAIELHCYAEVPAPDAVTERFHALADHWHSTVGLSDAELAEQIRRDRIDVLVDLAGHTAGNRLLTFARKPAPIQVAWLLGHGYTSGLSAMDAFLADAELAPPGADGLFSERLIRLSRIPLAYAPPAEMPDVAPLPALANGCITFGYFGRTVRLNDAVLAAWARILHAVPGSRLMLNSAPFGEPAGREQMSARFAALGIDPARLDLVYTSPQPRTWAAYGEIDIALDPFPHNAGTTTIEALWQGVPVLSLAGRPTVGRFGAAILHAVGLDDWVTNDVDAYVARADCSRRGHRRAGAVARGTAPAVRCLAAARRGRTGARDRGGVSHPVATVVRRRRGTCASSMPRATRTTQAASPNICWRESARRGRAARSRLIKFNQGDAAAAAALLQRSVDATPDAAVLSDLGVMLRAMGRLAEAEAAYRRALQLDPSLVQALGNLGNVLLDLHRADEAGAVLDRSAAPRAGPALAAAQSRAEPDGVRCAGSCRSRAAAGAGDRPRRMPMRMTHSAPCSVSRADRSRPKGIIEPRLPQAKQRHRVLSNLAIVLQTQGRHAEAETVLPRGTGGTA